MPKLTKIVIDALRPEAAYLIQYRTPEGRTRRFAFAKLRKLTPDQAQNEARAANL